jgi:UDP-N-acetylmuramoyl-L-alanyl-D-glutamate--2,6-diaminopimelate ligase
MPESCRALPSPFVVTERGAALATLLSRVAWTEIAGERDATVNAIAIDSREVRPGALFVALRGSRTDGHRYVAEAVANGARAVVVQDGARVNFPPSVTVVGVRDTRRALSSLAAAFYGDPSHDLAVIGVTGTNGKTTVTHMIATILDAAGTPCGVAGTVGAEFGSRRWGLGNTTPLPPELHRTLAEMRDEGAEAVAMEVSSHALALDRIDDVRFRVVAMTNVARDHLDFHETVEAYAAAKRRLFELAQRCVLNVDDAYGRRWAAELKNEAREIVAYGLEREATLVPKEIAVDAATSRFIVDGEHFELPLPGRFNVWNALAAIGVARFFGIPDATSAHALARISPIAGRMERIVSGDVAVVIDYAHTPDALESALQSLRETTSGALAVVFGCGGDRDRGKRPAMGAVAARLADRLYLTNDNPRSEDPQSIADAIAAGIGNREYVVELDRRRAIERAIAQARPGDVVLVAGKGHENYQVVGDRVLPFDDAAVAREALASRAVLQ